jgi:Zn-dependent M28 family amino/carboxypeptidase
MILAVAISIGLFVSVDTMEQRIANHIEILSSDEFQGRQPGTYGEHVTVDYIVSQFKDAGLMPAVNAGASWMQNVNLTAFEHSGSAEFRIWKGTDSIDLLQGVDVAIRPSRSGVANLRLSNVPVVFAGYGVDAAQRNWDDFAGTDVAGKLLLVLVNDPDFEAVPADTAYQLFDGPAMTYYGRWNYKYAEAARQGAAGVLIVHETKPASYGWDIVTSSNNTTIFDIDRGPLSAKPAPPIEGWINWGAASRILQLSGLNLNTLKAEARQADFSAIELDDVHFQAALDTNSSSMASNNVVAIIPGTKEPTEVILVSAHWDHLGTKLDRGDEGEDVIFNGAVDNATGVAALLELARALRKSGPHNRTIVFLALTAEEHGQLGAEFYVNNPIFSLGKTVAALNFDALRPSGPAWDLSTFGNPESTLEGLLSSIASANGRELIADPSPEAGNFFRYDHFRFAQHGVPSLSLRSGENLVKGGTEAGALWLANYEEHHYHQPSDEYDDGWNLSGIVDDVNLIKDLVYGLANSNEWPEWKSDSNYSIIREETRNDRR